MPSHEAALVQEARRLTRLQAKRRRLRRDLRAIEGEIKQARKNLKALASPRRDPFDQMPPLREFEES